MKPTAPASPAEVLDRPIGHSGLAAAGTLRRAGLRLGWERVRDLLFHLPRRYDDLREMRTIVELGWVEEGTVVSARVRVADVRVEPGVRRRIQRTIARLEDDTGTIEATWFGRRYIERRLHAGDRVVVSGRVKRFGRRLTLDNPDFQHDGAGEMLHVGRIVPVYRLTAGLTAARLRTAMRQALDLIRPGYPEYLPSAVRAAVDVPEIGAALEAAHYPTTFPERDAALRRLAFDELLALQLGMVGRRRARGRARSVPVEVPDADDARLRAGIERALGERLGRTVTLTADQRGAIAEIRADLAREVPMLRLLQGDVGSGKTAVAAWALAAVARQGRQGALLAPTDLLARQHAKTVGDLVADLGVAVELVTGSLPADRRRAATEAVQSGMAGIVVGTHALLQESLAFDDLALAVVDEQHRFGVEQRGALEAKSRRGSPHVLLMTATPIPRTVGQVVYADLDLSTLHTPPEGRLQVRTGIRHPDELDRLWTFVDAEAEAGRATFVVVPAIEETEGSDIVAAEAEAERLRARFPKRRIGLVHGRMKAQDRDAELARLRDGDLDILVGTTVLEVGVDVPRASVMIVESAELFGLAQLHQLRGRVGRGTQQSYAALVSAAATSGAWLDLVAGRRPPETTEQARLLAVAATTDGFELAERDFELRREGDVLGLAQSGLPRLRVATLASPEHRELAVRARDVASGLLDEQGALGAELDALADELRRGWLARVFAGDPGDAATPA
ncbi:MAG TPA: ATP-dependent DNA helicase RecG [Candidatus Limnocylindrales bacterium]|nr:ATP-dependent DNA helicase RecG [Candidatus Limnocylindrales bacterium]